MSERASSDPGFQDPGVPCPGGGVWMPVDNPPEPAARPAAKRRAGGECNVLATLGAAPADRERGTWSTDVTGPAGIERLV